ncbi:MAG: phage tail length tape measure family protein [Desulfuromonadales bacterium]|nr:phage tail length tape measure family protein [Desulfuromonadales bacterium]
MTLKIGTLEADITANTSPLSKAEGEVRKTGKKIEQEFNRTSRQVDKSFDRMGTAVVADIKRMDQAANQAAKGGMRNMRFAAGQLGFQIQDIAVQAQMGTGAMRILAQQGSQVLSVFGPGGAIAGAILAIGAAVGGAMLPALFSSKDAIDELEVAMESMDAIAKRTADGGILLLTERITDLAKKSEDAARAEIRSGIVTAMAAIDTAARGTADALEDVFGASLPAAGVAALGLSRRVGGLTKELGLSNDEMESLLVTMRDFSDDPSVENMAALQNTADSLAVSVGEATPEFINLVAKIRETTSVAATAADRLAFYETAFADLETAIDEATDATDKHQKSIDQLIASLTMASETYGKNSVEVALYKAQILGATEAEMAEIEALALKTQALKDEEQARKDARKTAEDEKSRQKSAAPKLKAIGEFGEGGLDKIAREEQEQREFVLAQTQITADEQAILLEKIHEERIRKEEELHEKLRVVADRASDQQAKSQAAIQAQSMNAMTQLGSDMNAVLLATGKEGSGIAKAIFLTMRAIQVAQIVAATEVAAANAAAVMALGGPVPYFATAAAVRAVGYTSAALVAGLAVGNAVGGGREFGGTTSPQLAHPINEAGIPEILNQGGKQYLLPTGKGGNITPLDKGGSGGGSPNITIISSGTPQSVDGVNITKNEVAIMINDAGRRTEGRINASLATGRGDTARSLQSGFKAERNLR